MYNSLTGWSFYQQKLVSGTHKVETGSSWQNFGLNFKQTGTVLESAITQIFIV